eukprot:TRINITY_DN8903_c0_g1_i1.p1 TRINITY_DN8903_c0_g1~~TRINITY_DN8903_c0_g1_i1.p1  ORF type:complete len:629 (+),score=121.07 TRINITY_DN8903_c0_g1_i1:241-1887(+)
MPAGWLLQEHLQPRLLSPDWRQQEVAVLALGAIAKGCNDAVEPHLDQLIQHLLNLIESNSTFFLVRSIACWTLSRYASHIAGHRDRGKFLDRYLLSLLACMNDSYRSVQEGAASAFSALVDSCTVEVCQAQYITMISAHMGVCLQRVGRGYTTRNTCILLDALGTLVWVAREGMHTEQTKRELFDPLFQQILPACDENSPLLPPLMYCLRRCVEGLGRLFAPHVPFVFPKVCSLMTSYWTALHAHTSNPTQTDPPDNQHITFAFRFCGCLITELREEVREMVHTYQLPGLGLTLMQVALLAVDKGLEIQLDRSVVDASVCFLGDCLKQYVETAAPQVLGYLDKVFGLMLYDDPCTNDLTWFCSEVAVALNSPQLQADPGRVAATAAAIANAVIPKLLQEEEWHTNILQQCAFCVTKLGLAAPDMMAAKLDSYLLPTCLHLESAVDTPRKYNSLQGLVVLLRTNPAPMMDPKMVAAVGRVVAGTRYRPADILQMFVDFFVQLRGLSGAAWPAVVNCLPMDFPSEVMSRVDPSMVQKPPPPPGPPPSMIR